VTLADCELLLGSARSECFTEVIAYALAGDVSGLAGAMAALVDFLPVVLVLGAGLLGVQLGRALS
jgi:hypothetical protein